MFCLDTFGAKIFSGVCSGAVLPKERYGFLERLIFWLSLDLANGFIRWLQFPGHTFKLDGVDEGNLSIFIVVRDRS